MTAGSNTVLFFAGIRGNGCACIIHVIIVEMLNLMSLWLPSICHKHRDPGTLVICLLRHS